MRGRPSPDSRLLLRSTHDELADLLARAYVRLLVAEAEKARNDAVSFGEYGANSLDFCDPEWPCEDRGDTRKAERT
jgi:hypothetical protein